MKKSTVIGLQLLLGSVVGSLIACSPTKFDVQSPCSSSDESCVTENGITTYVTNFKVGAGKVDILFVDDNSASMSGTQKKLAAKFAGFIENLDSKEIDYNIAITTTDLGNVNRPLVSFPNGSKVLRKSDSNRVSLFNGGIVRTETVGCEDFMKSAYYTYGPSFLSSTYYNQNYYKYCPSNDERGIYMAHQVVSENTSSFIRPDAHLNVIVISNEDVRSSLYRTNSQYSLEDKDKATSFTSMVESKYPGKFWKFNSIITKDESCAQQQREAFTDKNGQPIKDNYGNYVIGSNIGYEYAALSSSAAKDIDGNPVPRGQNLSICSSDYTSYFSNIASNIADSARLMMLKCVPTEAPIITDMNGNNLSVPYTWSGNQIKFNKGSEGIQFKVTYKCYTGVK